MVNNKNKLNDLQFKLLDMFKWFHETCKKNNLRYYALGGTMLGAIRHEGFIPWDDDIDVGMPRKDYIKFLKIYKGKMDKNYIVESIYDRNEDFFYGYAKIYDISTTLIEKTRMNIKRGIYIDVFPLDGVCNDEKEKFAYCQPIYNKYQFVVSRTCAILKRRKLYKNLIILCARLIPNSILNNKKMLFEIDKMCSSRDYDDYRYVGNLLGNWGIKEVVSKDIMGIPKLYKFENLYIYGVEKYDLYLTQLYGNWKILPPIEKRVSLHDCVECNLYKSYLNK